MRDLVDESVRAALEDGTGKSVSLGKTPAPLPEVPYGILYPIFAGEGYGSWSDPEECRDYLYQVRSVGVDPRQCGWMSKKFEEVLVGRDASGEFSTDITFAGGYVAWRLTVQFGRILQSGEELWQVDDTYRLRTER